MTKQANGDESKTVQSVERALFMLEVMAQVGVPITITELAQKTKLTLGTAHRLLNTMLHRGFVEQSIENSKYRLGIKIFQIGTTASYFKDLRTVARPVMEELQQKYNETVNLATLDGSEVVYVDQVESTNIVVVRMFARAGNRGPAHCTGSGKVLLAGLSNEQLDQIISKMTLDKFTNETITDEEMLKKELSRVRLEGYALDLGERDEGVRCVAAPIKNYDGKVAAAISISGPSNRITTSYIKNELVDVIKEAAGRVSQQLEFDVSSNN